MYASDTDDKLPSECCSEPWNHVTSSNPSRIPFPATDEDRAGKWMIFRATQQIDALWKDIKTAVENDRLGFAAKVSTQFKKQSKFEATHYTIHSMSVLWVYHAILVRLILLQKHSWFVSTHTTTPTRRMWCVFARSYTWWASPRSWAIKLMPPPLQASIEPLDIRMYANTTAEATTIVLFFVFVFSKRREYVFSVRSDEQ